MDMTQILLSVVGAVALWQVKEVLDLRKTLTEYKGEMALLKNSTDSDRRMIEHRLNELQKSFDSMAKKMDFVISHPARESGAHKNQASNMSDFEN